MKLGDRAGARKVAGGAADADRGQAPERDVLLDVHASSSSRRAAPRSTSPAPIVSATSPGFARLARKRRALLDRGRPADDHAGALFGERVDDQLSAHACDRLLAGPVDLRHRDDVRSGKRGPELTREMPRARVQVRLEEHEHTAVVANCGDRRLDLGGMVRVVVEHRDAAGLATSFEPATRACELGEVRLRLARVDAGELESGKRGGCVSPIVLAGNGELEVDGRELFSAHDLRGPRRAKARTAPRPRLATRTPSGGRGRRS